MSTYIIGDVQGCFRALMNLVDKIKFNPHKDELIFCGDLVNRGGQSLEVLKWIYKHRKSCEVVLGNHDLSLLAQFFVPEMRTRNKEFEEIFKSKQSKKIMSWLLKQKLLIDLKQQKIVIVHAGIYPQWKLKRAKKEEAFTLKIIRKNPALFFKNMYGQKPNHYSKRTKGMDRARFAINSFTRMRFLFKNSGLNFKAKGEISSFEDLTPWFSFKPRKKINRRIVFGHWSALDLFQNTKVTCIDTGKVWGGKLTAIKLSKKDYLINNPLKHITQV